MPDQGPRRRAGVPRLSERALKAHPDDEPSQDHLCHRPESNDPDQRLSKPSDSTDDGTSSDAVHQADVTQTRRAKPPAQPATESAARRARIKFRLTGGAGSVA
jgi:hypothetical protein